MANENLFEEITGETTVTESQDEDNNRLRDESSDTRPTTNEICPDCGNEKAYYEMKQIRAADESETRFFTCTDCGHNWREDDH